MIDSENAVIEGFFFVVFSSSFQRRFLFRERPLLSSCGRVEKNRMFLVW